MRMPLTETDKVLVLVAMISCIMALFGMLHAWRTSAECDALSYRAERAESRLNALEGAFEDVATDLESALAQIELLNGETLPALSEQVGDPNVFPPIGEVER